MAIFLKYGIFVFLMTIMYEDWKKQTIDRGLLMGLGIWTLLLVFFQGGLKMNLLLGLGTFLSAFLLYYFTERRNKSYLGGADPILLGILALLFYTKVGWIIWLAASLAILHHLCLVLLKKRRWRQTIPFGSYLSLVSISVLIYSSF